MVVEKIEYPLIISEKGNINKIYRLSHDIFALKEVYTSEVLKDQFKAWKRHKFMTCSLVVIVGKVEFVIQNHDKSMSTYILTERENQKLIIPAGFWFGFRGLDDKNILINCANVEHDENEIERKDIIV